MKKTKLIAVVGLVVILPTPVLGQSFMNFNFEASRLDPNTEGRVSVSQALPGWAVSVGGFPQSTMYLNEIPLGNSDVSLIGAGSQFNNPPFVVGKFSVILTAGASGVAEISQPGLIPGAALSLQFKGDPIYKPSAHLVVSFDGQPLTTVALGTTPGYVIYGADVSSVAGRTGLLSLGLTSIWPPDYANTRIDDLIFSLEPIPEPTIAALLVLGGLLVSWRRLCA